MGGYQHHSILQIFYGSSHLGHSMHDRGTQVTVVATCMIEYLESLYVYASRMILPGACVTYCLLCAL